MSELAVHPSNAGKQAYQNRKQKPLPNLPFAGRTVGLVTSNMTIVEASVGLRAEAPSLWCK